MKFNFKSILFYGILIACIVIAAVILTDNISPKEELVYSDIVDLFHQDRVVTYTVKQDGTIVLSYRLVDADGNLKLDNTGKYLLGEESFKLSFDFQLEKLNDLAERNHAAYLADPEKGVLEEYHYVEPDSTNWLAAYLPYIIVIVIVVILFVVMMRKAGGQGDRSASFARAKVKVGANEKNPVKFADVAGADEEKEELQEVVDFLKDPKKYTKLGARIPRGVLLVGPPGTGKTLLAKAVAGEAGVPFYSISGSDFVEMYVGVGASRVRDLFENARKSPASIIFIDEIDAVGRHRGAGLGGGHDEREQTLNQLLVEMDGFGNQEGVIVMAATNRPDILDPALLRPGRFDRQITVNYPDLRGREDILHVHARNKPMSDEVDLHKIAQTTVGFTGADLANLLNEAALLAARRNKSLIGMAEIEAATLKILVGTDKKKMMRNEEELRKTAYHEAGHAILAHLIPGLDPVSRISIVPTSKGALGYTLSPPQTDVYSEYKKVMEGEIAMCLGGRAAERIVFDDYSGGASQDIRQATQIARKMVTVYGMSDELGTICYAGTHSGEVFLGRDFTADKSFSEETAAKIDREIKAIIDRAYVRAEELLRANIDKLHAIVEFLMKHEFMEADEFKALMDDNATLEQLEEMRRERERKVKEQNERVAQEEARKQAEEDVKSETSTDPFGFGAFPPSSDNNS